MNSRVYAIAGFTGLAFLGLGFALAELPSKDFAIIAAPADGNVTSKAARAPEESQKSVPTTPPKNYGDLENQKPLENPPSTIKALYATNWSMANQGRRRHLVDLVDKTELNAIVIDIKDYTGVVPYPTSVPEVARYGAEEHRLPKINQLIRDLHDKNIYVIARLSVFQDLALAKARPDLALMSSTTGKIWTDHKGLTWMDTSAKEVWDYNIAIAKDALARGFDEINFDYIRFASDGNLDDIKYPFWDEKTLKTKILREFFRYLREAVGETAKISADLFGLATVDTDGLGIGQHLEYALPYFDAIAPMVYPSHYASGFIGYGNPGAYPYEVIKYSMDKAVQRINDFKVYASTTPVRATLRPWIQDFDLGADYDAAKVRAQIQAWYDAASSSPELSSGWMVWNASNVYTADALLAE